MQSSLNASSGSLGVSTSVYSAFGGSLGQVVWGSNYQIPLTKDPVGFGGQWGYYTDQSTGLVLMGHRYYNPSNGRFLTRDPIGYAGGINLYGFVGNNPITRIDPSGYNSTPFPVEPGMGQIQVLPAKGGTYYLRDPNTGSIVYVGRTNNLVRRALEHGRDLIKRKYPFEVDKRTDDRDEQKGREQINYEREKPPLNQIKPIGDKNPNRGKYMKAGARISPEIAPEPEEPTAPKPTPPRDPSLVEGRDYPAPAPSGAGQAMQERGRGPGSGAASPDNVGGMPENDDE